MKYNNLTVEVPRVSRIALGTLYIAPNQKKIFDAAYDLGINYFDTADSYNEGASDAVLAEFLKNKPRESLVISSKVFYPTKFGRTSGGLSKPHLLESVNLSLKRLNTDYLDILYLHRFDNDISIEETIEALNILLTSGKIKSWGFSAFSTFEVSKIFYGAKAASIPQPIVAQYAYNLFNRTIEMDLAEVFAEWNIKVVGYYGLAQGVLSGKYSNGNMPEISRAKNLEAVKSMWDFTPEKLHKAHQFADYCKKIRQKPSALALAWCLQNPNVASVLTHVRNQKQLVENVNALSLELNEQMRDEIEKIFLNAPRKPYTNTAYLQPK